MPTALVLTSSALGEASVSNRLIRNTVDQLRKDHAGLRVIERDLGANPVPHMTFDAAVALRGEPQNPAQVEARAFSDRLIGELKAADTIIIGAPMYNFGIASTLKAWFDYILRAGVTFRYTEAGPEGLLRNKRAIVVLTRAGYYSEGPARVMDSQEPHLRTLLGFMGITEVTFVRAEKLAFGPQDREQSVAAAQSALNDAIRLPDAAAA
jgi:FMN-dependent NADH-azoreductase